MCVESCLDIVFRWLRSSSELREEGLSGQTRATIYGAMRDMQSKLKKGFKEVTDLWKRDRNGRRSEYLSEAGLGRPEEDEVASAVPPSHYRGVLRQLVDDLCRSEERRVG